MTAVLMADWAGNGGPRERVVLAGAGTRHRACATLVRPRPSPVRAVPAAGLRRDQEMALYRGDPGRRGCSRPGRARLVQRVHVPVELRRVVGYLDPDVTGIDLRFALEGV